MKFDLNKDMDALLRQAGEGGSPMPAGPHLDADLISAFADDAVPSGTRAGCVIHLADCDRCRTILADIVSNRHEEVSTPGRILLMPGAPWYSWLLSVPKTLYAAAVLVFFFGGVVVLLITRNSNEDGREISRTIEPASTAGEGRVAPPEGTAPVTSEERRSDKTAGSASTSSPTPSLKPAVKDVPGMKEKIPEPPVAAAPPPPQASVSLANVAAEKAEAGEIRAASTVTRSAPMVAPKSSDQSDGRITVAGKTFERRGGVSVDVAYGGQTTIVIKRGTDDFGKLDEGLRSIADSVSGSVIVMWKGRAYRID